MRRNEKATAGQLVRLDSCRCANQYFVEQSSQRRKVIEIKRHGERERERERERDEEGMVFRVKEVKMTEVVVPERKRTTQRQCERAQ